MIRDNSPLTIRELPKGYTYEIFSGDEKQIKDWENICHAGLGTGKGAFTGCIVNYPDVVPETDVFFVLNEKGERVATSTSVKCKDGQGYVHMVASLPECRGKGVGNAMIYYGMKILIDRGCETSFLTTDDFRLAAIKTYLDCGFCPVIYHDDDSDMRQRWEEVLKKLNYKREVRYLEEN